LLSIFNTRPIDSGCDQVADAAEALAKSILQSMSQKWIESNELEEADNLAREAKVIKERMYGKYNRNVRGPIILLLNIHLSHHFSNGHYYDERRTLLE
jgi:hypothetical protein